MINSIKYLFSDSIFKGLVYLFLISLSITIYFLKKEAIREEAYMKECLKDHKHYVCIGILRGSK